MNTSWLLPVSGILNDVVPPSSVTVNAYPAFGLVIVTLWFVSNGWSGKKILWVGVDITLDKSPNVESEVDPIPTIVPTPIDSCGLKYTISFNFDSK